MGQSNGPSSAPRWLQYYRYVTPAEAFAVQTTAIIYDAERNR